MQVIISGFVITLVPETDKDKRELEEMYFGNSEAKLHYDKTNGKLKIW